MPVFCRRISGKNRALVSRRPVKDIWFAECSAILFFALAMSPEIMNEVRKGIRVECRIASLQITIETARVRAIEFENLLLFVEYFSFKYFLFGLEMRCEEEFGLSVESLQITNETARKKAIEVENLYLLLNVNGELTMGFPVSPIQFRWVFL
ncbi:hypothetical protein CDAR_496341 [Caerostris darwini]|uniref:Uncharacterized protein n=1 Tax=Caerostris darwini TaxID=1538125 RepID=A0AAV4MW41_9ARAC|nr:hypothetical protein CDAR_496341 [Caerostris darwini]